MIIHRSFTTRNADGSIKDFGLKQIRHNESYCKWDDNKKEWDYVDVPCGCEIYREANLLINKE